MNFQTFKLRSSIALAAGLFLPLLSLASIFNDFQKLRELPSAVAGNVNFVETPGYYPALTFEGKAAEATFKSLSVPPYEADDGTVVKAGTNMVCARSTRMEGLDEVIVYQCFQSVHPTGATYPGYLAKPGSGDGGKVPTPHR
jgi:hypothetical protein